MFVDAKELMIMPPIVGIPDLDLCNCASSLTCSFVRKCKAFSAFIKNGPQMAQTKNDMNVAIPPSRNTPESKVVKLSANATNMYTKHIYYSLVTC